ncbi:MAG: hypothetical protein J6Y28_09115 [Acholeplasmatales bacterium]|nr:hypothetical protein [Acholeplasmatales bacterium]
MERISQSRLNKKGISMPELIAYVILYSVVTSLLASLTYTIIITARKVNRQAILNRGATIMYTELLAETIALNPDTVDSVVYKDASGNTISNPTEDKNSINSISITFTKKWSYNDKGERIAITNPETLTYRYTKGSNDIDIIRNNDEDNKTEINLEYNVTLTSTSSDDIYDVISVDAQNSSNKYVTFRGKLNFDDRYQQFNFIIPVFVANVPQTTTPTTNP